MDKDKINAIFNNASEAVLILDSHGKIIFLNITATNLLQFDLSEIESHSIFSLLGKGSDKDIRDFIAFKGAYDEQPSIYATTNLTRKDSKSIPVNMLLSRIAHGDNDIFMMILKERGHSTGQELLENGNFSSEEEPLLLVVDKDLNIEYASANCEYLIQYSPPELVVSYSLLNLIHPEDLEKIDKNDVNITGKGIISFYASLRIKHKQAGYVEMEGAMDRVYSGTGHLIYSMVRLTKKTGNVRPSSYSKQFPDVIFHHLPDAVLVLDQQSYQLVDCNAQAIRMLEANSKDELISHFNLSSLLLNKQDEENLFFLQQHEGVHSVVHDVQWSTLKGEVFWGRTAIVYLNYDNRKIWLIQISEISQQKIAEQKLLLAKEAAEQALKSREDFLSTMSHEIRTPLNAVLGMTHLMLQKEPREDQKKLLQTLKFAGENLTALINDILDYSKIEAGKLELNRRDFNLKDFVQGIKLTYKNLANEKGLIFRLLLEEELPVFVHGDVNRLGQILNNLLNNAIKFTAEGQIVMSVYMEDGGQEYVLLFEVADTGIGIPADKQDIIFDPYQQASSKTATKFGGTGLGLSIVRNLVDLQEGELSLISKEGQGTTFRVKLPFGKPEDPDHSHENESSNFISEYNSLEGLKVLYVEDVIPNQLLMEGLCDNWNVDLDTALNGLEALEKVRKNQYDLILMDIQMPEKDGYETALEIRSLKDAHYENIPIIALSASVSERTKKRVLESGMDDYISKPIDPKYLHEKLAKFSKPTSKNPTLAEVPLTPSYETDTIVYVTDTPDFSQLHALYVNDPGGYIRILEQIRKLTLDSIDPVLSAVRNNDENIFRFTCHKLMSYIRLVKLQRLEELIETAKDYLINNSVTSISREYIATELEHHFDNFVEKINEELSKYN